MSYEGLMSPSENRSGCDRAGADPPAVAQPPGRCAAVLAIACVMALGAWSGVAARAQTLAEQCWPASELLARPGESVPRRGVPGQAARVPELQLQPFTPVAPELRGSIRRVALPPGKKLVALTFDLCEQPGEVAGYDGAIVDALRAGNVRATFFAGGKWLLTHDERAQQLIADQRFEIGSHGWAHQNVRGLAGAALTTEIRGPQAAFEVLRSKTEARQCVAGRPVRGLAPRIGLYRFPYGACSAEALRATAENGLLAVQWDISTGDPDRGQSAAAIVATVMRRLRPGSIVLMHANGRGYNTAAALPVLIAKLKEQGYQMVTVSQLLAAGRPEIQPTCYDAHPGDTDRYDRLFTWRSQVRRGP